MASRPSRRSWVDEPAGSVVIVVATDAPFDSATLRRVAVRAQNGLARTGCVTTHGSGELVLAFSTTTTSVREPDVELLNSAFRAVAEAVEEAVLSGLAHAEPVTGREGRRLPTLRELNPHLALRPATHPIPRDAMARRQRRIACCSGECVACGERVG